MASTYSTNLGLELIGTGDQSGTWGSTTNTNLGTLLEQAIVGYATQAVTDSGVATVLAITAGASSTGRNYVITLTGALTANRTVEVPAVSKPYIFFNNTTGGFSVTVKVTGQTGVTIANGKKAIVYANGTDVIEVVNAPVSEAGTQTLTNKTLTSPTLSSPTMTTPTLGTPASGVLTNATGLPLTTGVTGTLPVANGGTGVTGSTGSGNVVLSTSPTLVTPALGTPASGVLTNATGLPLTTGVTGTLPVANGGTGAATLTANAVLIGNGTGAVTAVAPSTAGNVLTSDGTNWASTAVASGSPVGSISIQAKINSRVTAASGTGSTATVYFVPALTIPVGSLITVAGVTPSGYNATGVAVTASSTLSFSATGSISGTTLTVSSVTGTVSIGQEIFGNSVNGNTYITSGSGTTWTLNRSQTVSSTTITGTCGTASYANTTTAAVTVLGTIVVAPSGYLACDGSIYTRSSYPSLAAYIGTPVSFATGSIAQTYSIAGVSNLGICAANNVVFASGSSVADMNSSAVANGLRYSTDSGVTWNLATGWSINYNYGIAYGNGVYVQTLNGAVGLTHSIAYGSSPTTITSKATVFTASAGYTSQFPNSIAFGNGIFLYTAFNYNYCTGVAGSIGVYSSTNGSSWTFNNVPVAGDNPYMVGTTSGFLASSVNRIFYSTNGASWSEITSNFTGTGYVSAGNGLFIVTTSTGIYTSSTGTTGTWALMPTPRGITVPANFLSLGYYWGWTGYAWVTSVGYITVDFVNFSSLTLPSAATNFFYASGQTGSLTNGNISYLTTSFNTVYLTPRVSYTASTQFPVPNLTSPFSGNQVMGGASEGQYFIKT
jgi:hypothetical protein